MRPTAHEVSLQGGTLVVPLNFATLLAISQVPMDPLDVTQGAVDPGTVVVNATSGRKWPHVVTAVRVLHAAAGLKSPGAEALAGWASHKDLTNACVELCAKLILALAPEKAEAASPKP